MKAKNPMTESIQKIKMCLYYRKIFKNNRADVDSLFSMLADQQSKDTLANLMKAYTRIYGKPEYYLSKAANAPCTLYHFSTKTGYKVFGTENPYFLKEIFSFNDSTVYLDGGAYIGDTIETLFKLIGKNLIYVYAFEPNHETYEKLKKTIGKFELSGEYLNLGLSSHDGVEQFYLSDSGSRISKSGDTSVQVINTGRFLSELQVHLPTFIKLDIEGSEQEVLDSAQDYIKNAKPDLAISVYHKLEDLWEIPLMIHKFCPNYKIYLRHQSNYYTETICYATVR